MKTMSVRRFLIVGVLGAAMTVSACSTEQVIDNSVGVAAGTTKLVAKGAVGASKLAYQGGKSLVGAE